MLQPDGRIVVAGVTQTGGDADFALARWKANGSKDKSFGSNGKVTTKFTADLDTCESVLVQPDVKIVAGGYANDDDFALVRYNRNGTLDTTFGSGGLVTAGLGGVDRGNFVLFADEWEDYHCRSGECWKYQRLWPRQFRRDQLHLDCE